MICRSAARAVAMVGMLLVSSALAQGPVQREREEVRFFESRIRPVLIEHCYDCHNGEAAEPGGGLLVDSREGLLRGGVSGPAIVAGRPESSLLLAALRHSEPKLAMPPPDAGDKLTDQVIADFERWIRRGAVDPRDEETPAPVGDAESRAWWAWQPIEAKEPPADPDGRLDNPIDRFWMAALRSQGIEPNSPTQRATLVRRLAFDLTGLPPTPEVYRDFVTASQPLPIEELVDRYLDSPEFGVRFGRRWLDVARYAESSGQDANLAFPHAWRYRDYVIDAFNEDMPFDRFIREQLAGDLLPSDTDQQRARQVIATGFLAIGPKTLNEMNPHQFAVDLADEQIDAFSQAFLGVTIACARCHDHKFDPVSHRDYTAVAGIFLSSQTLYGTPGSVGGRNRGQLFELPEGAALPAGKPSQDAATVDRIARQLEGLREQRVELQRELVEARRSGAAGNARPGINLAQLSSRIAMLETQLESMFDDGSPNLQAMAVVDKTPPPREEPRGRFGGDDAAGNRRPFPNRFPEAGQRPPGVPAFAGRFPRPFELSSIIDSPQLIRGELDRPGEPIPRGLPEYLAANRDVENEIPRDSSGRLELAEWVASADNSLTARVITNRVWAWLLGKGLVESVDNFGTTGQTPSHPELLDHLATAFVNDGWSIKSLVRQIVLSDVYALASDIDPGKEAVDPDNRLLWRANMRPLEAECLRDAMLAAAGELDTARPDGSLISQNGDSLIGAGNRLVGLAEDRIVSADGSFRSVYLPQPRQVLPDVLNLFDVADNSVVSGVRETTLVPSQALYWLNSPRVDELAMATARRVVGLAKAAASEPADRRLVEPADRRVVGPGLSPFDRRARMRTQRLTALRERALAERGAKKGEENLDAMTDRDAVESRLRTAAVLLLAREPHPTELDATLDFVAARAADGDRDLAIWTSICKSLISSGDFRFLR